MAVGGCKDSAVRYIGAQAGVYVSKDINDEDRDRLHGDARAVFPKSSTSPEAIVEQMRQALIDSGLGANGSKEEASPG